MNESHQCVQSYLKNHQFRSKLKEFNYQLSNAVLNVSPAMLPRGRLLSPASTGNMHKGVIICQKTKPLGEIPFGGIAGCNLQERLPSIREAIRYQKRIFFENCSIWAKTGVSQRTPTICLQTMSRCFRTAQDTIYQDQLKNQIYLIRFGHTKALLFKKK